MFENNQGDITVSIYDFIPPFMIGVSVGLFIAQIISLFVWKAEDKSSPATNVEHS